VTLTLIISVAFLLSPIVGYVVIALDMPVTTKIIIGGVGAFLLIVIPLLVLILSGG